ncbi:Hypothetical predicted protein [Paramuricea clavata]|uniref:Uncharacterized protein n=1 Tax=Paramuricea clavata TaxID=317549 RepID=A0A6S7JND3_PARCT|nr:Hypothetical predicted protein [Paramuricea clavata]
MASYLVNFLKSTFSYNSSYWTNKKTYSLKDGLEGLTDKETKLASYWNTPFNKICLGMKVNSFPTSWTVIDHQASSLFNLIKDGNFTLTKVGISAWESLVAYASRWLENEYRGYDEGFNFYNEYVYARIGFALSTKCKAFVGFGTAFRNGEDKLSNITCGYALCKWKTTKFAAFGYILAQ